MSIDHGGKYLATGSEMGVVNLYNLQECHSDQKMQPKPLRALTNLTTTIDFLEFNPDSQVIRSAFKCTLCAQYWAKQFIRKSTAFLSARGSYSVD